MFLYVFAVHITVLRVGMMCTLLNKYYIHKKPTTLPYSTKELSIQKDTYISGSIFFHWYLLFSADMLVQYTDKNEKEIFLIYKKIQMGAVAKSYMRIEEGLPNIWGNAQTFNVYESYMTLQPIRSDLPLYMRKIDFLFFISVQYVVHSFTKVRAKKDKIPYAMMSQ